MLQVSATTINRSGYAHGRTQSTRRSCTTGSARRNLLTSGDRNSAGSIHDGAPILLPARRFEIDGRDWQCRALLSTEDAQLSNMPNHCYATLSADV